MSTIATILGVVALGWAASACVCAIVDELWYRSTH